MRLRNYEEAILHAKHNARRTDTNRYVFAYVHDWHCETRPAGMICRCIMPNGTVREMYRDEQNMWRYSSDKQLWEGYNHAWRQQEE